LRGAETELPRWKAELETDRPLEILDLPYSRLIDKQ